MTRRHRPNPATVLLAVAAATSLWSCGGRVEGPTSPVALPGQATVVPGEGDDGGVTASATGKITICHKGKDLQVPASALGGHLGHGDRLGSCSAAVDCPCFTPQGLADVAAQCTSSLGASCPSQYSLNLFCVGGGAGNLGLFEARLGTGTCSTTTADPMTGDVWTSTLQLTPAQYEACRQAIVGSSSYPGTCPR